MKFMNEQHTESAGDTTIKELCGIIFITLAGVIILSGIASVVKFKIDQSRHVESALAERSQNEFILENTWSEITLEFPNTHTNAFTYGDNFDAVSSRTVAEIKSNEKSHGMQRIAPQFTRLYVQRYGGTLQTHYRYLKYISNNRSIGFSDYNEWKDSPTPSYLDDFRVFFDTSFGTHTNIVPMKFSTIEYQEYANVQTITSYIVDEEYTNVLRTTLYISKIAGNDKQTICVDRGRIVSIKDRIITNQEFIIYGSLHSLGFELSNW